MRFVHEQVPQLIFLQKKLIKNENFLPTGATRERTLMLDKNLKTGESLELEIELEHDKQFKNHHWRAI